VRICGRIDVEERVHLATGPVSSVMAIGRLLAILVLARVGIEPSHGIVSFVTMCLRLLLLLDDALRVRFLPCRVGVPGIVRGVLVPRAVHAWVVALPPVFGGLLVVGQRSGVVVADDLLFDD
jgi:hypothetical protein